MDAMECRRSILGTKRVFGAYPSLYLHLICTHSIPSGISTFALTSAIAASYAAQTRRVYVRAQRLGR